MTADEYAPPDGEGGAPKRVQELPADQRPRERLLAHGPAALQDDELLQILIGSGVQGRDVVEMSQSLLDGYGLSGLLRTQAEALLEERGLGPATVTRILAAVQLGWRAAREEREKGGPIRGAEDVWIRYGYELANLPHEEVRVLVLNRQNSVMADPTLYKGTVHGANVRIAELLRCVIVEQGVAMIMVHNHPSGDPTPSRADRETTKALAEAADLMDIDFLDHIIIGGGVERFRSLKAAGVIEESSAEYRAD